MLVFEVKGLRALGSQLPSESPIRVAAGPGRCLLMAKAHPVSEPGVPAREATHCYDGKRFSRKRG